MNNFCTLPTKVSSPEVVGIFFALAWIGLVITLFLRTKQRFSRILLLIILIPGLIVILFGFAIYQEIYYQPTSGQYHVLNAAIKNTCYLDPQMKQCPHNVQELISIEPEHFSSITRSSRLTYYYYPETNQYTLIVRNTNRTAAIFDPRLHDINNYGLDFIDVDLSRDCSGKYQIDPPVPTNQYESDKIWGETIRQYNQKYGSSLKIN